MDRPTRISIEIYECDAQMQYQMAIAYLDEHMPARSEDEKKEEQAMFDSLEGKIFYRSRIRLNDKQMQIESPVGTTNQREELLKSSYGKAWSEISNQALPPEEKMLVIAG